ncbi:sesquipedalian-1-like [Gastrophryne carolinensis]
MKLEASGRLASSGGQMEGFLLKRGSRSGSSYQRRWFLLGGNLLLYWERRPGGEEPQPLGLILLEGSSVTLRNAKLPFAFSLCSASRVYKMAAESQRELEAWVRALLSANLGYTRALLGELRARYLGLTQGHHRQAPPSNTTDHAYQEPEWGAEFQVLHRWLGEEILPLRGVALIDYL